MGTCAQGAGVVLCTRSMANMGLSDYIFWGVDLLVQGLILFFLYWHRKGLT